jgi:hypothetical protein
MSQRFTGRTRRRNGEYSAAALAIYRYLFAINEGVGRDAAMDLAVEAWRELRPEDGVVEARSKFQLMLQFHLVADQSGALVWRH